MGIDVVSTWHREMIKSNSILHPDNHRVWQKNALSDLNELTACTHFVLFSMGPTAKFSRGSHCFEAGFAAGLSKRGIVVGARQVIFHHLKGTRCVPTWELAKRWLKKEKALWSDVATRPPICIQCGEMAVEKFYRRSKPQVGFYSRCIACFNTNAKVYREKNQSKIALSMHENTQAWKLQAYKRNESA
jgi:hypothetical protein